MSSTSAAPPSASASAPVGADAVPASGGGRHGHPGAHGRLPLRARLARLRSLSVDEHGAATAEYAIATLAAVGLAGVLVVILKGDEVRALLSELVRGALRVAG